MCVANSFVRLLLVGWLAAAGSIVSDHFGLDSKNASKRVDDEYLRSQFTAWLRENKTSSFSVASSRRKATKKYFNSRNLVAQFISMD